MYLDWNCQLDTIARLHRKILRHPWSALKKRWSVPLRMSASFRDDQVSSVCTLLVRERHRTGAACCTGFNSSAFCNDDHYRILSGF